ncbi:MAG TPA: hypothetical protein VM261_17020 [Kofleriaceae bacterium]|nr:hypothetical protein [Kofleriaceae bacterium]
MALVTSRVGLVTHELVGHGGAAKAYDADIRDVHLYYTAGGWISYDRTEAWTWTSAIVVQLAGIAVELVMAIVAGLGAWWAARRGPGPERRALAAALGGAALGFFVHAGFYFAAGVHHGMGDGTLVHQKLGSARGWLTWPVAVVLVTVTYVGARRLGAVVRAWLPARSTAAQLGALAVALGAAAGAHAGMAATELALRPSPTYQAIMKPAREKAIDADVARWADAELRAGRAPDRTAIRARRANLDRERPRTFPFGPLLGVAIALAAAVGAARGRPTSPVAGEHGGLPKDAVLWAVTCAVIAALSIGGIDALAS